MNNEELCRKVQAGDTSAFEELLTVNMPFIKQTAYSLKKQFNGMRLDADDLIQEGSISLFKAAKSYDPFSGNAFLSFASKVIENGIRDYIRSVRKYNEYEMMLSESSDRTGDEDIFESLSLDQAASFERLRIEDYASYRYSPEQIYIKKELYDRLYDALDSIPERGSTYLKYRYGFIGHYRSREETAELFSLSGSRAGKIEKQAIADMRAAMRQI